MHRRHFLRRAGLLAASSSLPLLSSCASTVGEDRVRRAWAAPDTSFRGACGLPPVIVSPDREIRTVAGLRPFRPSGFVVRAEALGDTLLVHNYGHGGAGITLSWGTSKLAVDIGAPGRSGAAAVIGCGAVGLANARLLQEAGFDVTIYTKAMPPDTTSNVAGGQWFPAYLSEPARRTPAFNAQMVAAARYAQRRYQIMVGPRWGVRWMRNYFISHRAFDNAGPVGDESPIHDLLPELRTLGTDEHPFPADLVVRQSDTLLIEPPVYLAAMLDEFRIQGGRLIVREFDSPAQVAALPEKLVFNCTGLGAKALFNDAELMPIKGQLTFLLPQPEVQYATAGPDDLYMFPRSDGILLGGTHEEGVDTLEPDLDLKRQRLAEHAAFFGAFRRC